MNTITGNILLVILFCICCIRTWSQPAVFEVTYTGMSAEAETAFTYATDIWNNYLVSDVPIKIIAHAQPLLPGQLGITFPNGELNFAGAPVNDVWYASCLANAITVTDQSPDEVDMEIYFNSFANWYYGLDENPGAGEYDFVSSALHEICHGLGFLSLGNKIVSEGSFGLIAAEDFSPLTTSFPWPELDTLPSVFDIYLEGLSGDVLTGFENPSAELGTSFTSNLIYFNSPIVVDENDGVRPKIYAPASFTLGSSLSHWDEGTYPVGDENEFMTPQAGSGVADHTPGILTLSVLEEIGWEIVYDTATTGLTNIEADEVVISPNPAKNNISIDMNSATDFFAAEIINTTGSCLMKIDLQQGSNKIEIGHLPQGYYLIRLTGNDISQVKNFIKN